MSTLDRLAKQILSEAALDKVVPRPDPPDSPSVHWTQPVLLERAAYLRQMARYGNGAASETLREFPGHAAMLIVRSRSGDAEMHAQHAHFYFVLSGAATIVTGGWLATPQQEANGATHADTIEGGERQELRPGDVVYIPAGVPHQLLVNGEKTISCLVLKIQETA